VIISRAADAELGQALIAIGNKLCGKFNGLALRRSSTSTVSVRRRR
jgi:hypothetical protein